MPVQVDVQLYQSGDPISVQDHGRDREVHDLLVLLPEKGWPIQPALRVPEAIARELLQAALDLLRDRGVALEVVGLPAAKGPIAFAVYLSHDTW
jgi:hypothetical protein